MFMWACILKCHLIDIQLDRVNNRAILQLRSNFCVSWNTQIPRSASLHMQRWYVRWTLIFLHLRRMS